MTESSVTESSVSRFSLASALFSHITRFMGYYFMCVYWPGLLRQCGIVNEMHVHAGSLLKKQTSPTSHNAAVSVYTRYTCIE